MYQPIYVYDRSIIGQVGVYVVCLRVFTDEVHTPMYSHIIYIYMLCIQ